VKVPLLLRVRRGILARKHADQPNVVGPIAQDLESLHEPGQALALDAHLLLDLGRGLRRPRIFGWYFGWYLRRRLGRRGLGDRTLGRRRLSGHSRLGRHLTFGRGGLSGDAFGRSSFGRLSALGLDGRWSSRLGARLRRRFGARLDRRAGLR
jgi:hypothetical protein